MSFKDTIIDSNLITEDFKTASKSLKRNKAACIDTINSKIVRDTCNEIKDITFLIFNTSFLQGTLHNILKIAKLTPFLNQVMQEMLLIMGLFQLFQYFQKILRESFTIEFINI